MNCTKPAVLPDGRPLRVDANILPEPASEGRLILWLPGERHAGYRYWERVLSVARATVATRDGICSVAATSAPARQRLGGPFGTALRRLLDGRPSDAWTLPDGGLAEPCGARRADLRLAWAEDETLPLDAGRIAAQWPGCGGSRQLGRNLFLVAGFGSGPPPAAEGPPGPAHASPRALATRALEVARATGDRPREVTALVDLGLARLAAGEAQPAAEALGAALAAARRLENPDGEADAASGLALIALSLGRPDRARGLLDPVLARARAVGDRLAEKLALDRLAQAQQGLGDPIGALAALEQARAIARAVGDHRHEADLLWRASVLLAELGDRAAALAAAGQSVERRRQLDDPTAAWYAHHLEGYRSGGPGPAAAACGAGEADFGGSIDASASAPPPGPRAGTAAASGPGPLRMALTAAKAMATFVGSGFRTASPAAYRARLAACASCGHHTGLRCRACGCITVAKARLHHERCPLGKW